MMICSVSPVQPEDYSPSAASEPLSEAEVLAGVESELLLVSVLPELQPEKVAASMAASRMRETCFFII